MSRSFARTKAGRASTSQTTASATRSERVMPLAVQISAPKAISPASDVSAPELSSCRSTPCLTVAPGKASSSQATTSTRAFSGSSAASNATNGTSENRIR